jgi:DNA polymerase-3 subunit gamma/tau
MATTEPENIPQTIRSRCQHFSFHAVKFDDILAQLKMIAAEEKVAAGEEALALLAEAGDGSMRDALSIMDQAIASAPLEIVQGEGRPTLSTEQIRELMGSVPSTVFEKLLEAVAAAESAPLIEQLNTLLNAGHSPLSLARQMVRYLRNTLMAKIGGEQTELLQISADERARAARTALLFSEEELTRNLQIVLRTFDDLNYRQEQRFHLELGMLKLIHAQRLLPIEELLSGVAGGAGVRTATPSSAPRASASAARPAVASSVSTAAPAREPSGWNRAPSPMQSAAQESSTVMSRSGATAESAMPGSAVARELSPFPVAAAQATGNGSTETLTEGALARAPETDLAPGEGLSREGSLREGLNVESIRQEVVAALANSGHGSAAQLLGSGAWRLENTSVQVAVPGMGKKMLSLTVNTAAEKIVRQELQRLGAPTRFVVAGSEGSAPAVVAAVAVPVAPVGSVQEAALQHPMVKRAQEIFKAEVRSVVDLRQK